MSEESIQQSAGGDGGGPSQKCRYLISRRDQVVLRQMSPLYPITGEERQEVVDAVMDTLRKAKSPRTKLAAAKTIAVFDRVNQEEVKLILAITDDGQESEPSSVTVNNTVVVQTVTVEGVLSEYADVIEESGVPGEVPASNGTGKQVHPPKANGKTG